MLAKTPLDGCQLLKREIENWEKRIEQIEVAQRFAQERLDKVLASKNPDPDEIAAIRKHLERLESDLSGANENLDAARQDHLENCNLDHEPGH